MKFQKQTLLRKDLKIENWSEKLQGNLTLATHIKNYEKAIYFQVKNYLDKNNILFKY